MTDKLPESPYQREAAEEANKDLGDFPEILSSRAGEKILNKYEATEKINAESVRDPLTGAFNRRYYEGRVDTLMQAGVSFGIVMFDIDHFKDVNDVYGHPAGDSVLKEVTRIFNENIRIGNGDSVNRWGGEEFCIIYPGIDKKHLEERAEKIRGVVEKSKFRIPQGVAKVTVSGGYAVWDADNEEYPHFLGRIDMALNLAKRKYGRNNVKEGVKLDKYNV
jgi:diguanylate cyclase